MEKKNFGVCGVHCSQCPQGNGRVRFTASELKRLIDTTRYDWLEQARPDLNYSSFRRTLEWFAQAECPGCHQGGGAPCLNRTCASEKKLRSCLECQEYLSCEKTGYVRDTYPFVTENYTRVRVVGLDAHNAEEEERASAGVDLMGHLERRYCKHIRL